MIPQAHRDLCRSSPTYVSESTLSEAKRDPEAQVDIDAVILTASQTGVEVLLQALRCSPPASDLMTLGGLTQFDSRASRQEPVKR